MPRAFIAGTGAYAPDNIVRNDFFEAVGSSDAWIQERLGIRERRISKGETTSDLAAAAARIALKDAGLAATDIDLIVVATATPDRPTPSCACFVQEKLGATNAAAFDIAAVCSGALFSIASGAQFIQSGMYEHVLVIGADTFSNIIDWSRRDSVFFGDGAGAVVLSATEEDKGFLDFLLHADGTGKENFTVRAGGSEMPASEETLAAGHQYFHMNGQAVFETAIDVVPKSILQLLERNNVDIDQVACLLPHQPSIRILKEIAGRIGMPFEKVKTNMDRYANTSGGTIPIILDETRREGDLRPGDLIVFAAVGAGWTWGTALYKNS